MSHKPKIAFFGPFNTRGGREIELGFISMALAPFFETVIYSTERMDVVNDVYAMNPAVPIYHRTKNILYRVQSYIGLKPKPRLQFKSLSSNKQVPLEKAIASCDAVFILAQLTSNFTKEIIEKAHLLNKKILFRTTGTNPDIAINSAHFNYLNYVHLFINHSLANSAVLTKNKNLDFTIIDQCVFKEQLLMDATATLARVIRKFYCVARLESLKKIHVIIAAFNDLSTYSDLELHIIGDGPEKSSLTAQVQNPNIYFHGHVAYEQMIPLIATMDCLIIASKDESGPYSAVEAMLLGMPIISTKVGAMLDRFKDDDRMWFEQDNVPQLTQCILNYAAYDIATIRVIKQRYKARYQANYSKNSISQLYVNAVTSVLK